MDNCQEHELYFLYMLTENFSKIIQNNEMFVQKDHLTFEVESV